jgi:predicted nucleic acid-binding protein
VRRYLLDTSLVAGLLNNRPRAVALITPWIHSREVATSILVYGEVVEYIKGRPNYTAHHRALRSLLRRVHPYFLTYPILERYADLRRQLRPPRGPGLIGDVDTLIASTALERNLTVVTTDSDFQRVPSLAVMLLPR